MNILLVCSAGMSTSMLVTRMEKAAAEQGVEAKIWAVSGDEAKEEMKNADVVLLGPQVRFLLKNMKAIADPQGIPVEVINSIQYGMMDGKAVLEAAVGLAKK
ncbi:PTS sugar transporter subunit IIB [Peribacillus frigoritolerans]|uniref:PTS sugar transporter subunit IIB n=1 Tax=Peribacillus frigoritolerans TaxID=450367 RepID=UPI001059B7EB|nr:PTS sugar transporter subunit IIB [Peribacillus frigoritolerans]TDL80941.1 PTS sugar transporter subunit IIB [Peribacillus frigoritolerans]